MIGFRYVGGSFASFGDDNPDIAAWSAEIFQRMDPERVVRIANLSGHSKELYFRLSGYDRIPYAKTPYYSELVKEFFYRARTNGLGFAIGSLRIYGRQKATEAGLLKQKLNVAEE